MAVEIKSLESKISGTPKQPILIAELSILVDGNTQNIKYEDEKMLGGLLGQIDDRVGYKPDSYHFELKKDGKKWVAEATLTAGERTVVGTGEDGTQIDAIIRAYVAMLDKLRDHPAPE